MQIGISLYEQLGHRGRAGASSNSPAGPRPWGLPRSGSTTMCSMPATYSAALGISPIMSP